MPGPVTLIGMLRPIGRVESPLVDRVTIVAIDDLRIRVRDLEALDATPVLDVKPVLDPGAER